MTPKGAVMSDSDKLVMGESVVDVTDALGRLYIRVRYRNIWKARLALRLVALACFAARCLGVGVRLVPDGRLYVPRRTIVADIERRRRNCGG